MQYASVLLFNAVVLTLDGNDAGSTLTNFSQKVCTIG